MCECVQSSYLEIPNTWNLGLFGDKPKLILHALPIAITFRPVTPSGVLKISRKISRKLDEIGREADEIDQRINGTWTCDTII